MPLLQLFTLSPLSSLEVENEKGRRSESGNEEEAISKNFEVVGGRIRVRAKILNCV